MSDWQFVVSLIIVRDDKVLMLEGAKGWHFPSIEAQSHFINLHLIQREIQALYQADMSILRELYSRSDEDNKTYYTWYLMENRSTDWQIPEPSRWFGISDLDDVSFMEGYERAEIDLMFLKLTAPVSDLRPMFMHTGWFAAMRKWVSDTLQGRGYKLQRPPEQFKQFTLTSILRTETDSGTFYAKATNPHYPLFCDESHVMLALSRLAPDNIPAPIAIHPENGMGIFPDFGAPLWETNPDAEQYKQIVRQYAAVQQKTASQVDQLEVAGCLNRRLDVLKEQIAPLFDDEESLSLLDDEQKDRLLASQDRLGQLCDQLAEFGLPYTLVHGDFHGGNIAIDGDRVLFFDWTDACIAHPFFDILTMMEYLPELSDVLREAYLQGWQDYAPSEHLESAFAIAEVLSALHQLVSYRSLLIHSSDGYDKAFRWSIPDFTKVVLDGLGKLAQKQ